jgi:hypothetical protein
MIVLKYSDVNIDDILFTKNFNNNNNNISIKCFYNYMGKKIPLIFQSPEIYIPFGISEYNQIDISLNSCNQEHIEFKKILNKIEDKVKILLKKRNVKGEFKTNLKYSTGYPDRLKLYIDKDLLIFDNNKEIFNKSLKKLNGKIIINLSNIWSNNNFSGIFWKSSQIMVYPKVVIKEFCFLEEDINTNIELPVIYYKMIKNRIPLMAVKHKMAMDNIDKKVIESIADENRDKFVPKEENKMNILKINPFELQEIKLKKTETKTKVKFKSSSNPLSLINLNDIKKGLKNLKPIS